MFTEQELLEIEERLRHTKVRQAFLECIDAIVLYNVSVYDIEKSTHIYEAEEEWENSPEIIAEVEEAKKAYQSGDYLTLEDFIAG